MRAEDESRTDPLDMLQVIHGAPSMAASGSSKISILSCEKNTTQWCVGCANSRESRRRPGHSWFFLRLCQSCRRS